jgi:hypothetical protein
MGLTALCAFIIVIGVATEAYGNNMIDTTTQECTVNRKYWLMSAREPNTLTLPQALFLANKGWNCTKKIIIDVPGETIFAGGSVVIDEADGLEITGIGGSATKAQIDFRHFQGGSEQCAVDIRVGNVTLRDMDITTIKGGTDGTRDGICMNGGNIRMFNVDLRTVPGDGFVFGPNSALSYIDNLSSAHNVTNAGIADLGSGSWNILDPANGVPSEEGQGGIGQYVVNPMTGIVQWESAPTEVFEVSIGANGTLMTSNNPLALKVSEIEEEIVGTKYRVTGFLARDGQTSDTEESPFAQPKIDCGEAQGSNEYNLIAMFAHVSTTDANSDARASIKFMGFVGKGVQNGIDVNRNDGSFEFVIDNTTNDNSWSPEFAHVTSLYLIPMLASPDETTNQIVTKIAGRGTPAITLADHSYTDCTPESEGMLPGGRQGGNNGPIGSGGGTYFEQFPYRTLRECSDNYNSYISEPGDGELDSDGDGINDLIEMGVQRRVVSYDFDNSGNIDAVEQDAVRWVFAPMDGDCYPNGKLTKWYKADSDFDGLIDRVEVGHDYDPIRISSLWMNSSCPDAATCPDTPPVDAVAAYGQFVGPAWDITSLILEDDEDNPDVSKPTPNANELSPDSDSDGIIDGLEDRSRTFYNGFNQHTGEKYMREYYQLMDATSEFFSDPYDMPIECDLSDQMWGGQGGPMALRDIGVAYGLFYYYADTSTEEGYVLRRLTVNTGSWDADPSTVEWDDIPQNAQVVFLKCVNVSVAGGNSFNGIHEGTPYGETNWRKADSDGDCVCDGGDQDCLNLDKDPAVSDNPQAQDCKDGDIPALPGQSHAGLTMTSNDGVWLVDNCPNTPEFTRNCPKECIQDETLFIVAYQPEAEGYVVVYTDNNGNMTGVEFTDSDNNSIPDLFEEKVTVTKQLRRRDIVNGGDEIIDVDLEVLKFDLMKICGDHDNDGIPSCVENWEGTCNDPEFLDPFNEDTDEDGLLDGSAGCDAQTGSNNSDVCPFPPKPGSGESDEFVEGGGPYSCEPTKIYRDEQHKGSIETLAYFLDRDCDGLFDAEEDKNMDGQVDKARGWENSFSTETNYLSRDTDGDTISDFTEIEGWPYPTNPAFDDTDEDGLTDVEEDRNRHLGAAYEGIEFLDKDESRGCDGVYVADPIVDTDPNHMDTDGDGLNDKIELTGVDYRGSAFADELERMGLAAFLGTDGLVDVISDPTSIDSDGDGLLDSDEYGPNGVIFYSSSHPCMWDTDGDERPDFEDPCPMNLDTTCDPSMAAPGADTDSDGLDDYTEVFLLGTDPNNKDTDGDKLFDGEEDVTKDGIIQIWLGETDPKVPDTDGDGLTDGIEVKSLGTDPNIVDTDGDCLADGIEDANHNGQIDPGETNPLSIDSDGDGLPDGYPVQYGYGEDIDCDGERDIDPNTGQFTETSPVLPDSDLDGYSDYEEMFNGGYFNINNIGRANTGRGGCTLAPNANAGNAHVLIAMMLGLALVAVIRMRKILRLRKDRV